MRNMFMYGGWNKYVRFIEDIILVSKSVDEFGQLELTQTNNSKS